VSESIVSRAGCGWSVNARFTVDPEMFSRPPSSSARRRTRSGRLRRPALPASATVIRGMPERAAFVR